MVGAIAVVTHRPFRVASPAPEAVVSGYPTSGLITGGDLAKEWTGNRNRGGAIGGGVVSQSTVGGVVAPAMTDVIMGDPAGR